MPTAVCGALAIEGEGESYDKPLKGADKLPVLERKIEYGGKNPVSLCSIANGQAVSKEGLSTKRKEKTKDENF